MNPWTNDMDDDLDEYDANSEREQYDPRDDDFRCYGCERNIGRGGYCDDCQEELR